MGAQVDGARHAGYELGYTNVDELMSVIDYLMTYAPPFSESSLVHCPLNAVLDWPMCMPSDDAKVIVSACEASPYAIRNGTRLHDRFWIKSQPYSLQEIFTASQREIAQRFGGGSVYQAFLSAFNYHRWHAPVSGTVVKAYLIDGTYYSDLEAEGEDPGGLNDSQGYTTAVAARAVIVIDCDDQALGTVACVFVGMAEVSSCVIEAMPAQHVAKGDELGFFQYGGSTYCLIFEPGVIDHFVPQPPFDDKTLPVKVNAHLATAR
jgi:phosphatidylserine decarboxylase